MKSLNSLLNATLEIEKLRVAAEVRKTHLLRRGRKDSDTEELHRRLVSLEAFCDGRIADLLTHHPAYDWFSRVKGVGRENIGKVVGLIRVAPEKDEDSKDLQFADTISALWQFAGLGVENGKAPKRRVGEKLHYNSTLRAMCWRLGSSLLRAKGKFYDYYQRQKANYELRYINKGMSIVPAAKLPEKDNKKYEPEGIISEGHVHNQALRKMIKLFLACLWLTWREGLGLELTKPYAIDKLGHDSMIKPWDMVDK